MQHTVIRKKLDNGISLVLVPLSSTEAVTVVVLLGVGSRYESDQQQGLAHFTEHMVFKGGRKYTSTQAIAQSLDAIGGEFNAFTSQEFTGFYTKTASRFLELGIDILSDMVLHAEIPEIELEKEKGVIVEEINMYEDMPMRKVDHVLTQFAFGDTPLGRPILGTKQSVTAFTREDFLKYREQFYKGEQCTVVIAGALNVEQATELVSKYFSEMPKGEPYKSAEGVFAQRNERVFIEERTSEQTHLMLAVKGYKLAHQNRYAYRVLTTILGGNMSSRLFVSVREEQGLCYYVRASPDIYSDIGLLVASAGVDNSRLSLAVSAIMHELQSVRDYPVPEEELNRAKQYLVGKMLLGLEDSEQVAEYYGMQDLLEKDISSPEEVERQTMAVTIEQVQQVAQELLVNENLRLAVIGPQKDREGLEKLLTFS